MTRPLPALVFDTGPLRHFAVAGWLGVLKFITHDRRVLIPDSVERELRDQRSEIPSLAQVFEADWIHVDRGTENAYLFAFARYEQRLVSGTKNRGECGVLALGSVRGHELVLDDAVPRQIAADEGMQVTTTLALLCTAIRERQLTVSLVEQLADDLLAGTYYLPFPTGGFRTWALQEGLLDYEPPELP